MWCPLKHFTQKRHGRRAAVLALVGLIWLAYGWAIYSNPTPGAQFGYLHSPVDEALSSPWSCLLWVVCGLIGIGFAVLPSRRPDAVGFNALLVPPLIWTVLYGWSWLMFVVTRGGLGSSRSWVSAVIWSAAVVVVAITAGWPDPEDPDDPYDRC